MTLHKIGLKYILTCIAIISASLAIWQVAAPEPTILDSNNEVLSRPNFIHAFLFWNVRPYTSILGVATLMHLLSGVLGLQSWLRWIFSISAPTAISFGFHVWDRHYVLENNIHSPMSITSTDVLILNLLCFTIGFCVVSFFLNRIFNRGSEPEGIHVRR